MPSRNVRSTKSASQKMEENMKSQSVELQQDTDRMKVEAQKESVLIAVYPILYLSKQYAVGDALPASEHEMVEAWIGAGTAAWVER